MRASHFSGTLEAREREWFNLPPSKPCLAMKRPAKPYSPRDLELATPPFRIRAFVLALAALAIGIAALVLALTSKPRKAELLPAPSAAEPPWPEGFVEWTALPAGSSSTPAAADS